VQFHGSATGARHRITKLKSRALLNSKNIQHRPRPLVCCADG